MFTAVESHNNLLSEQQIYHMYACTQVRCSIWGICFFKYLI